VHPSKTEVHLLQEELILPVITRAVRTQLERNPATPGERYDTYLPGPLLMTQRRLPAPRRHGLHAALLNEEHTLQGSELEPATPRAIAQLRPLAQLQQAAILAEAPDGALYIIDQHRAHERVIYEHLRDIHPWTRVQTGAEPSEQTEAAEVPVHLLLEPVLVELKRYEAELLEQRLPLLRGLGIECERFGGRSFLVRSVPASEGAEQLSAHLKDLVSIAAEDTSDWVDQLITGLACHSALKRGLVLSLGEQQTLVQALARVAAPAVCPHGSPILLHYSRSFLTERFDW
jgi:DNA mismatch repair protein MutL